MTMLTVKQLAAIAGVTPRTLHHYDSIGLLKPALIGENNYRYYGKESLILLQQIMFYRELDLPLEDIKKIMESRDFDVLSALEGHKAALGKKMVRLESLLGTIETTIDHLKGEMDMTDNQLFSGFNEEEQEEYATEAEKLYDPEIVKNSNRKWQAFSVKQKENILKEGHQVYLEMVDAMPAGAESKVVQDLVERWRSHMNYFWTPKVEQLVGLAELYNNDPRFREKYDRMHPELATFMLKAVNVYVSKRLT